MVEEAEAKDIIEATVTVEEAEATKEVATVIKAEADILGMTVMDTRLTLDTHNNLPSQSTNSHPLNQASME